MVKTQMTSLNHKHGENSNDEFKTINMVKTQMMSLNHKHGKNSNDEFKS